MVLDESFFPYICQMQQKIRGKIKFLCFAFRQENAKEIDFMCVATSITHLLFSFLNENMLIPRPI